MLHIWSFSKMVSDGIFIVKSQISLHKIEEFFDTLHFLCISQPLFL